MVSSAKTGEPVVGAKVYYEFKPELYVLTDENGYYELLPRKEFEFFAVILATGHPTATIFNLVVESNEGSAIVETGSCIGSPGFECIGRTREVNFTVQ